MKKNKNPVQGKSLKKITQTQLKIRCWNDFVYGLWTHDDYISNHLQPTSVSQFKIENLVKCTEILAFCRKNSWVMQNHTLGIRFDKIRADSSSQNTLKYLTTYSADLPNLPKYLGYLKKSSHWVSVVCDFDYLQTLRGTQTKVHLGSCYFYKGSTMYN